MQGQPRAKTKALSPTVKRDRLLLATASLVMITAVALLVNSIVFEKPAKNGAIIPVPSQNSGSSINLQKH